MDLLLKLVALVASLFYIGYLLHELRLNNMGTEEKLFYAFMQMVHAGLFPDLDGKDVKEKYAALQLRVNNSGDEKWEDIQRLLKSGWYKQSYFSFIRYSPRAWWEDLEGVVPGYNFYASILEQASKLTNGAFQPTNIQENWVGDSDVSVSFTWQGKSYTWPLVFNGDWADPSIFININALLQESGREERLYFYAPDQTLCVLFLTKDQAKLFAGLIHIAQ